MRKVIKLPHNDWRSYSTIKRANNHLNALAKKGKVIPIRHDKQRLEIAVPKENAIYTMFLNKKGSIKRIIRF